MSNLAEVKRELQLYIAQAQEIENQNMMLKEKVSNLEIELNTTKDHLTSLQLSHTEEMKNAQSAWRQQALEYGRKQRNEAYEECDSTIRKFKSFFLEESSNRINSLISSLIRSKFREYQSISQSYVFGAIAHSTTVDNNLIICDFDVIDNHVAIRNRSHSAVLISKYCVKLRHSCQVFTFPEAVIIHPVSSLSIWFGKSNQYRQAPRQGSFVWSSDANIVISTNEIADLYDSHDRLLFSVSTNQHTEVLMNTNNQSLSSADSRKRKRDSTGNLRSPSGKSSSTSLSVDRFGYAAEVLPIHDKTASTVLDNEDESLKMNANWESLFLMPTPKPSLHHRNSGPLSIIKIELSSRSHIFSPSNNKTSKPFDNRVSISIVNHSNETFNLKGWRMLVIGYPIHTFDIPDGSVINPKQTLVITSLSSADTETDQSTNEGDGEKSSQHENEDVQDLAEDTSDRKRHRQSRSGLGLATETISMHTRNKEEITENLITRSGYKYKHGVPGQSPTPSRAETQRNPDRLPLNPVNWPSESVKSSSSNVLVIHDLSNIAKHYPYPRSVHLLDDLGHNACEYVESGDLLGIFGTSMSNADKGASVVSEESSTSNNKSSCSIQ